MPSRLMNHHHGLDHHRKVYHALFQETHSDDEDGIPPEFADLYKDKELTQTLIDLIHTAADLDILDFQSVFGHVWLTASFSFLM